MKDYGGKVRVVYKNLVIHPDTALPGHLANCAAGNQGKFMEFKKAFWDKAWTPYSQTRDASKMGPAAMEALAAELGLNMDKFKADMNGKDCMARMEADAAELQKFGVGGTPSFFINGTSLPGMSEAQFKQIIDQKLKEAEASGIPAEEYYQKAIMEKGEKKFRSKLDPKPS